MIGSDLTFDVTVKAPRERSHLGAFGKMSGLSGRRFLSFPAPSPPPPPLLLLFAPFGQCLRALTPLGLKETETTATQAIFSLKREVKQGYLHAQKRKLIMHFIIKEVYKGVGFAHYQSCSTTPSSVQYNQQFLIKLVFWWMRNFNLKVKIFNVTFV